MIKVSVIIPVYNVEKYLPDCLDSVLKQSLKEIEIICIDDASPDNCGAILDAYAAKDHRLHVLHLPENRQQGYGRNRGLELARGRYVYFLDSDDMITDDALDKLFEFAERNRLNGVFFDARPVYESIVLEKRFLHQHFTRQGTYEDRVCPGPELFEAFGNQNEWTCMIQQQFWDREFLVSHGLMFSEGIWHEDEFFSFRSIMEAERAAYLKEPLFIRRFRADSETTSTKGPRDFYGYFKNYCLINSYINEHNIEKTGAVYALLTRIYEWMILTWFDFNRYEKKANFIMDDREKALLLLFETSQKLELSFSRRIRDLKLDAEDSRHIWIYGGGLWGRRLCHGLLISGWEIEGFLVSDKKDNPDDILGFAVKEISEVTADPGKMAIVAVSKGNRKDVCRTLEKYGWKYIIFH